MKKLGLIGGTGPESTLIYYRDINYLVNEKTGGRCFPNLSVESVDLYRALSLCADKKYDELCEYLLTAIENLARSGTDFAALTANTMHIVFDELKAHSPLPLVSIVDTACEEAQQLGMKKIGLLGTIFTMESEFFKKPFYDKGIDIVTPDKALAQAVNDRIATELEFGIVKPETTEFLTDVIKKMSLDNGIEAIVLGCTELPLALNDKNSPVPCLDTMKIHIRRLVDMIIE